MSKPFVPLEQYNKDCVFPNKSSRKPCSGDENGGTDPGDIDYGLMGQVSGWDRPENGKFPPLLISTTTSVIVPAGKGFIVDPASNPTLIQVSWGAKEVNIARVDTAWITTIAVDALGSIVQLDGNINPEWSRTHVILGTVTHVNGTIDAVQQTPSVWGAIPYAAYDLAMAERNNLMSGGSVHPNTSHKLGLDILPRKYFFYGGSPDTPRNQNVVVQDSQLRISYFPVTGRSNSGALTADLPVTKYNPTGGSSVETVPGTGNESTAFRLYQFGDRYLMLYGQQFYNTLQECVAAAPYENFRYPDKAPYGKLLAIICVRRDAKNLKDPDDAVVITTPPGGQDGNEGSGSSGGQAIHFFFEGDGVETDFFFPLADADGAAWYDTYLEKTATQLDYIGQEPEADYIVELDVDDVLGPGAWVRFTRPPGNLHRGFCVLRGALQRKDPNIPVVPISLDIPFFPIVVDNYTVVVNNKYGILQCTSPNGCTVTIPETDPLGNNIFNTGSYFSVQQRNNQVCTIVAAPNVQLRVPAGMKPQTRARDSVINAICDFSDMSIWFLSGDLAKED